MNWITPDDFDTTVKGTVCTYDNFILSDSLMDEFTGDVGVFRFAVENAAASIVLAHNPPSGDPTPSDEDVTITRRLVEAGRALEIPILDHVILGDNAFHSLKESGAIP